MKGEDTHCYDDTREISVTNNEKRKCLVSLVEKENPSNCLGPECGQWLATIHC
jgi:hypothetical protein